MNHHEARKEAERKRVLTALRAAGEGGLTGADLTREAQVAPGALSARLLELEGAGLVRVERPARPRGEWFRYFAQPEEARK